MEKIIIFKISEHIRSLRCCCWWGDNKIHIKVPAGDLTTHTSQRISANAESSVGCCTNPGSCSDKSLPPPPPLSKDWKVSERLTTVSVQTGKADGSVSQDRKSLPCLKTSPFTQHVLLWKVALSWPHHIHQRIRIKPFRGSIEHDTFPYLHDLIMGPSRVHDKHGVSGLTFQACAPVFHNGHHCLYTGTIYTSGRFSITALFEYCTPLVPKRIQP